jgi:hypothetical protein
MFLAHKMLFDAEVSREGKIGRRVLFAITPRRR